MSIRFLLLKPKRVDLKLSVQPIYATFSRIAATADGSQQYGFSETLATPTPFDALYLPCCCGYNPYAFIAHTVQQRVKLPPPGGFLRIAVREEKLIYRNMIPGYKVIEYL